MLTKYSEINRSLLENLIWYVEPSVLPNNIDHQTSSVGLLNSLDFYHLVFRVSMIDHLLYDQLNYKLFTTSFN